MKVTNMISPQGNKVVNQYIIETNQGKYFQSYESMIAFIPNNPRKLYLDNRDNKKWNILLDETYWDYSRTSLKYLNIFLGTTSKKQIEQRIKSGEYILTDLNK